jgi:hypothetical protein
MTPGPKQFLPGRYLPFSDMKVTLDAIAIVVMMPAVFAADVMAVDPMMAVVRPMAGNPDHFPFATPVARAMAVVWPVAELDANSRLCRKRGPESEARNDDRHEQ